MGFNKKHKRDRSHHRKYSKMDMGQHCVKSIAGLDGQSNIFFIKQSYTKLYSEWLILIIFVDMKKYHGHNRDSGIDAYEIGDDSIILRFKNGTEYLYTYLKPGKAHVDEMKKRAASGDGLNTYLNQHVREKFEKRLK